MIKRGYIEMPVGDNKYKVRIPDIHGVAGDLSDVGAALLPICPVCAPPNFSCNFAEGDIVFVAWENGIDPIIIGSLFVNGENASKAQPSIKGESLKLINDLQLGNVTTENFLQLEGCKTNIQKELEKFDEKITQIEKGQVLPEFKEDEGEYKVLQLCKTGSTVTPKWDYPQVINYKTKESDEVSSKQAHFYISSEEPSSYEDNYIYIITDP